MNIINATTLALIFNRASEEDIKIYTDALNAISDKVSLDMATMLRFEKSTKPLHSIVNNALETYTIDEVNAYKYRIRDEVANRFAFVSDNFKYAFSIRFFSNPGKFNKFKANHKIKVLTTTQFRGATVITYKSAESDVTRLAVFSTSDADLSLDAINEAKRSIKMETSDVSKTSLFN